MQQVQQGQQTDPVKFDDVATIVTPKTSFHDLTANTVDIEEVHMLPISNETTVSPLQKKMKDQELIFNLIEQKNNELIC